MCVWNNDKFLEGIRLNTQSQSQNMNSTDIAYLKLYGNKIQWHLPEVWFGGDVCQFVMLAQGRLCGCGMFCILPIVVVIHTHERTNINQN